jgi:hypothetical protein
VLRYRISCSSISVFFLSDPAWAAYSVLDTDCGVHIALRINHHPWLMCRPGHPQPPQRRLHSAARPHQLHRDRAQHRPQPPERRSAAGAALGRRSGARPPERRPQPPERASTERRSVWFLETRIDWRQVWNDDLDAHRRMLSGSPADQNNIEIQSSINEENKVLSNINEEKQSK